MKIDLSEIAGFLGHDPDKCEKDVVITGFSTDTRTLKQGDLFFAVNGENFDGGDYVEEALRNGAVAAVTERNIDMKRVLTVPDTVKALGAIAYGYRKKFDIPVVAVTGSSGKTTVKDMLTAMLSQVMDTHFTRGNLNNHIGMPMTLLGMESRHEACVVEMGMNSKGEIDYLSKIAAPTHGVITNIGNAHIGRLGSREAIFKAKTEMVANLKKGGTLIINGDDEYLSRINDIEGIDIVKFGLIADNDIKADNVRHEGEGFYSFECEGEQIRPGAPGKHNVYNALAALAVGKVFGLDIKDMKRAIEGFGGGHMRMDVSELKNARIINDAYNANPDSMKAALEFLAGFKGRKIAVLGDMLELGGFSGPSHREIGEKAAKVADVLVFCGKEAENYKIGALKAGRQIGDIHVFDKSEGAGSFIEGFIEPGDIMLLKGSRGMKMEIVLEYLKEGDN